jgi:hypothetical protein
MHFQIAQHCIYGIPTQKCRLYTRSRKYRDTVHLSAFLGHQTKNLWLLAAHCIELLYFNFVVRVTPSLDETGRFTLRKSHDS